MLIALALEPVRGDVAVGSVQAAPHLVLLPAEAEEAASGGGVGSRKAVAAHPHPERQIVSPADDSVPVLGNHPHAAQMVTQEVLHLAALQVDVAEVRHYAHRIEELGISITYQRTYISGKPRTVIRTPHSRPRTVSIIDRLAEQGALRSCILRVMADDFRCQVKQIISDFKAAERIIGDISVGIVAIAVALWAVIAEVQCGLRRVGIALVSLQVEDVAFEVIAYVPFRPATVRCGCCSGADCHRAATQPVQTVVAEELAALLI